MNAYRNFLLAVSIAVICLSTPSRAARWNTRTAVWSNNANLTIGDWGFDRPGYPKGLYIHGITVKAGEKVTNPVIYDNDVYDDVFDDELVFAMRRSSKILPFQFF